MHAQFAHAFYVCCQSYPYCSKSKSAPSSAPVVLFALSAPSCFLSSNYLCLLFCYFFFPLTKAGSSQTHLWNPDVHTVKKTYFSAGYFSFLITQVGILKKLSNYYRREVRKKMREVLLEGLFYKSVLVYSTFSTLTFLVFLGLLTGSVFYHSMIL